MAAATMPRTGWVFRHLDRSRRCNAAVQVFPTGTPSDRGFTTWNPSSMAGGMAEVIDGKATANAVRAAVQQAVPAFRAEFGIAPGLATVLVGDDAASAKIGRASCRERV